MTFEDDETKILPVYCGVESIPKYFQVMYCSICDKKGNIEGNGAKGKCRRFSNLEASLNHGKENKE